MFSLVIPNFTPALTRNLKGFSLIELLVAISLLSIVMIGGFAIFNLIQENYLREAGRTNQVRDARSDADTFFINFHDNTSFNASSISAWPVDDPATTDNETNFAITALWGNDNWIDASGDYECRLTGLDTTLNTFDVTTTCFTDRGVTQTALKDALTASPLPSVILVGASHPCIITDASGSTTTRHLLSRMPTALPMPPALILTLAAPAQA